jgi:ketosteroid isomerase-like protein
VDVYSPPEVATMGESWHREFDPEVVEAHQMYVDAINSNETKRVMDCYHPDAMVMPPDEPIFVGHDWMKFWVAKYFGRYKTHWRKISKAIWVAGDYGFDQGVDFAVDTSINKDKSVRGPTQGFGVKGILIYKRQRQKNGELKYRVYRDIFNFSSAPLAVPLPEDPKNLPPKPKGTPSSDKTSASGEKPSSGNPKLDQARKKYAEAINSNKVRSKKIADLMACYDKDAAVMPPDAPLVEGLEALRTWVASHVEQYKLRDSRVVWAEGDYGFDQGAFEADTPQNGGRDETVKGILVYKRQKNGEFKVFRDIWNHNSQPKMVRIEPR